MNALRRLRWPAIGVLLYVVFLIVLAPAHWAGILVAHLSHGQITLSGTKGSLWDGSADLQLRAAGCRAPVALGRWSWRAGRIDGAFPTLAVRAGDHPWARVVPVDGAWAVRALRADVPAEALCALPAVAGHEPSGTLAIVVERGRFTGDSAEGRARIDWRRARLGAVSAAPAGDHRIDVDRAGDGPVRLAIAPLGGPLRVSARGEWFPAAALQARGEIAVGAGGEPFRAWIASGARPVSSDRFVFTLDLRTGALAAGRDGPRPSRS